MILNKQFFPGDNTGIDHKADNVVATSTPLPTDKGISKANVTPPMDVAGKPDTTPQEPKEKTTPGSVTPIHAKEPQLPRKERDKHATDRKRESQGRTGSGNFHTTNSHDPDHRQDRRKKRHHHPAKNGKTPQHAYSLGNESKPTNQHAADEIGNYGKQKTPAARRKNCKPQQTIVSRNPRTQRGRNNKSAGKKPWSKDVQKDTGKKNTPGGHQRYANSQHRNAPTRKV